MAASPVRTAFDEVDGYGIVDLPGGELTVGPIRCARKVLERTTIDLVRHATYALAIHRIGGSGAAAALNLDRGDGDGDVELAAFAAALGGWSAQAGFRAVGGLGLDLPEIGIEEPRLATSASNAASAIGAAGSLTGASVMIASSREEIELLALLDAAGAPDPARAELTTALAEPVDVLFVRGRTGELDHERLVGVRARRIVSLVPLLTTARGLAVASRAGSEIVPDFVSAGGQYLASIGVDSIEERTADVAQPVLDAGTGGFIAACELAEAFLRTWTDELPFGRPLAP